MFFRSPKGTKEGVPGLPEEYDIIMREVSFIAMDVDYDKYTHMSVGCGSLLAALQSSGCGKFGYTSFPSWEIKPEYAEKHANDLLGRPKNIDILFGVYVWNDLLTRKILSILRDKGFTNRIILGGPQITSTPKDKLETIYPHADVFIRGEGENVLVEVTRTTEHIKLPGVHYSGDIDDFTRAEADLTTLPSPFIGQYEKPPIVNNWIPVKRVGKARWETKRGCPFRCWFCQHRGTSNKIRYFSKQRLFDEMKYFIENNIERLTVVDPTFNTGSTYKDILNELISLGYNKELSLQCRFECVDDEFLELVKRFDTCLEFGLQTIHPTECKAINRQNDLDKVVEVMEKLHHQNIHYEIDLMYGLPAQTVDSFRHSVEFCQRYKPKKIRAWPFMLLRGTELDKEEHRKKWGLKESNDSIPVVISSNSFDESDWKEMDTLAKELRNFGEHDTY